MAVRKINESILSDIYKEVRGRYPDLKYSLNKYSKNIGLISISGFDNSDERIDRIDRFVRHLADKNGVELSTISGPDGVWGKNKNLTYTFINREIESKSRVVKESSAEDRYRLNNFMDDHYYGLPKVKLSDLSSEEIKEMRNLAKKFLDKAGRDYARYGDEYGDGRYLSKYRKYFDILDSALKIVKDKEAGVYDLKRQIEKDIWSCIKNQEVDYEKLKDLSDKYKDNRSLFYSIRKRILGREMWYD